jgi:hypothetical protein
LFARKIRLLSLRAIPIPYPISIGFDRTWLAPACLLSHFSAFRAVTEPPQFAKSFYESGPGSLSHPCQQPLFPRARIFPPARDTFLLPWNPMWKARRENLSNRVRTN